VLVLWGKEGLFILIFNYSLFFNMLLTEILIVVIELQYVSFSG